MKAPVRENAPAFIAGLIWFLLKRLTKKMIAHIQQAFWCIDSLSYHVIIMADLIASAVSIALMVCSPVVIKFCGLASDQEYQLRTYVSECSACCPLWFFVLDQFLVYFGSNLFCFKSILKNSICNTLWKLQICAFIVQLRVPLIFMKHMSSSDLQTLESLWRSTKN